MTKQRIAAAAFVTLGVGLSACDTAQGPDPVIDQGYPLKGLTSVAVVVALNEDADRDGLTKAAIQTEVELKLRLAGLGLLTDEELRQTPDRPVLEVAIRTHRTRELYAFSTSVTLRQIVESRVNPAALSAVTWRDVGYLGTVGASNLQENVLHRVRDQVDVFLNEWLIANPM